MHRTILDNTFQGQSTSDPKFNIMANNTFKRKHPVELANATAVLDYAFINPLPFNEGSYVNFYMESIKSPFDIKIDYHEHISAIRDASWTAPRAHCVPGQDFCSVPMNGYGLRKIDDMRINFIAQDPSYRGSLGLINEIHFNEPDPVPEPLSLITMGGNILALTRKRRSKNSKLKSL